MFKEFWDKLVSIVTPAPVEPLKYGPLNFSYNPYKVSEAAIHLIKHYEGYSDKAYLDSVKIPTIGYGTIKYSNGRPVSMGDTCTKEQASLWFAHDFSGTRLRILRFIEEINLPLNDNQFGALVSFGYNLGTGVITSPNRSMGQALRAHDMPLAAEMFLLYTKAGGKSLIGLERRRQAEKELFLKPV
jgi:lysozyme